MVESSCVFDCVNLSRKARDEGFLGTRNRRIEGNGRRVGSAYSCGKDAWHVRKTPRNNRGGWSLQK
jgi:hypothetical protein